jgi:hypothetical protein
MLENGANFSYNHFKRGYINPKTNTRPKGHKFKEDFQNGKG